MRESSQERREADLELARSALQSDQVWQQLVERYGPVLWRLCGEVSADSERENVFAECWSVLRDDNGAVLRRYDGSSSLACYLQFVALDVLSRRVQTLLQSDPSQAWLVLEKLFSQEIRRQVFTVIGSPRQFATCGVLVEDVYQDLAMALSADSFRRLRAYSGRGSFVGYFRRVVRNLCLDWKRKHQGRRRLPAAIARMGELEQQAYQYIFWDGCSQEDVETRLKDHGDSETIRRVLHRVQDAVETREYINVRPVVGTGLDLECENVPSSAATPEELLLEEEYTAERERLLGLVRQAVHHLSVRQRLYIRLRFFAETPLSPRQIAEVLGQPEREVYHLRQETAEALRVELARIGLDAQKLAFLR